jgi:hypothetical protein
VPNRRSAGARTAADADLFAHLALGSSFGALARFDLPSRKLPVPRQVGAGGALRDQQAAVAPDERDGNLKRD